VAAVAKQSKTDSWFAAAQIAVVGVFFCVYALSAMKPSWNIPTERNLITVGGIFSDIPHSCDRAYAFVTDSGQHIWLGCIPDVGQASCLENNGVPVQGLVGREMTIGYFHVDRPLWKLGRSSWPDILTTVSERGTPILSFSESQARLQRNYADACQSAATLAIILLLVGVACLFAFLKAVYRLT